MTETWPTLKAFAAWYWGKAGEALRLRMPAEPLRVCAGSFELVLFRAPPYQVELIALFAGHPVPRHRHPNVDSMDAHLTGTGEAWIAGRLMPPAAFAGHPLSTRRRLVIPAGVPHWGHAETTTTVISCQRWKNGVPPTFITDDWDGPAWR